MQILAPNTVSVAELRNAVAHKGYGMLNAANVAEWAGCTLSELQALSPDWDNMPPDNYLKTVAAIAAACTAALCSSTTH